MTRTKTFQLLSVRAAALFLFVGGAHANILVSRLDTGQVDLYSDSGVLIKANFLTGYPGGGDPGGEGISCLSGSTNRLNASNNTGVINVYNLTTGAYVPPSFPDKGGSIAALSFNSAGTVLYAGNYGLSEVLGLDPNPAPGTTLYSNGSMLTSHDVAVGPNGNVFATSFNHTGTGVNEYDPTLATVTGFIAGTFCSPTAPVHCATNLGGMVFDASGNLWVTSVASGDNGIFEFGPTGAFLNFTPDPTGFPIGLDISPTGMVIVANLNLGTVSQINPASCSVGTCTLLPFFTTGGEPKYVKYIENCQNPSQDGYVEICKQSSPARPVSGTFDFTATAPFFSSGNLEAPVGYCTGPIRVPAGTVTLTEAPAIGAGVSEISAYGHDQRGNKVNRLDSSDLPDQTATVTVVPGGVELETVATFTNYAPPPGQLKICKIAGPGITVGTNFNFTATGLGGPHDYQIPAGPADQGGFCVVDGTFLVNTPVTVAESVPGGVFVSNITVTPADRGGPQTSGSVVATIGSGITEVDFTDAALASSGSCQPSESLSVLVNGNYVTAYVPHGNWGGGPTGVGVLNIEGTSITPAPISTGTDVMNSCASNWVTGQTVCTANNAHAYLITGTTLLGPNPFTTKAIGTISFSGGVCTNCGVAMDAVNNRALIGMSTNLLGLGGWQLINLRTKSPYVTLGAVYPSPSGRISEDSMIDPTRNLLLSAEETGNYQLVTLVPGMPPAFFQNATGAGELDSSAEDCSNGIALAPVEGSTPTNVYVADLKHAAFTGNGMPNGTWIAPSRVQSLTESNLTTNGDNGTIAVAQGTDTGVLGQEFGGNTITAFTLYPSGSPAVIKDWVTCNLGGGFVQGLDPHTVTAYQSPNGSKDAMAVLANSGATSVAIVDLTMMLAMPRDHPLGHGCVGWPSGTLPAAVVTFKIIP